MFIHKDELVARDVGGGVLMTVLGSCESMNVFHWLSPDGACLPEHTHPEEQFGYLLQGGFEMTIGDETRRLAPGDSYFIPAGTPHSFRTIGVTEAIDIFSPPRQPSVPAETDST